MKIFDCSNSPSRPEHRGGGGPVTNESVQYLKRYCHYFEHKFVEDPKCADVIFTNDVFPKDVLQLGKRLVKRMDGIFWQPEYQSRNEVYNRAAQQADHVIFVSEYSKKCYEDNYGYLKSTSVVTNWADPGVYYRYEDYMASRIIKAAAIATDWSRPEKNFDAILALSEDPRIHITLIGTCETKCPPNIYKVHYISNPYIVTMALNSCDVFLNFSINDACPKVVAQAICTGLPVLYLDSGGVSEMVGNCGIGVPDCNDLPKLLDLFKRDQSLLMNNVNKLDKQSKFNHMLEKYFDGICY